MSERKKFIQTIVSGLRKYADRVDGWNPINYDSLTPAEAIELAQRIEQTPNMPDKACFAVATTYMDALQRLVETLDHAIDEDDLFL